MNLEKLAEAQSELKERSQTARSKLAKRNAGNRKRKRTRVSIKALLVTLAQSPKTASKVRAWAIQQLLLLGGKPVQPFEELSDDPETTPESSGPKRTGDDLEPARPV